MSNATIAEAPKPLSKPRADQLIQEQARLVSQRANFETYWQSLHDYFYIEAPDVNKSMYPGNELDANYLWDATSLESADVLASGFMNYLTPPTAKWARLRHRDPRIQDKKSVSYFFEEVMEEVTLVQNRSNFYDQMFPMYKSSGVYGTSLLFAEEDVQDDARFTNMPLKQVCIKEDAKGRPIGYFMEFEYTANQAAGRFGEENLSTVLQLEIKSGKGDEGKHKFLLYIGTRYARDITKTDKKNMPIEACWVDVDGKTIVEESGYHEFPAMVHQFDKRPFVPWGYSPAMKGLPFARLAQAIAKTNLRAMMKHTDPPLALPNNAFIAPFNSNPRATNYYNKDAMDSKGIFAFGNFGDPKAGMEALAYYTKQVQSMMFNDAFLMFQNITKEMNNPEVMERINEKMTLLGPSVGRYMAQVLKPSVQRIIGILSRRGRLPKLPDELHHDPNFEVDFVGVLAQAQRRSELNTLVTALSMIGNMASYAPEVLDGINPDEARNVVWDITSAPVKVLRDDAEIAKIRKGRAEEQLRLQQEQQIAQRADVAKNVAGATKGFADAQRTNK